ncbi:unnamed protein product [Musa banksii]
MESYKGGLKGYWKRRGYHRADGGQGRRRLCKAELGGGGRRRRRFWRIKISPRLGFLRAASPRRILARIRDAYVRMMLGFANCVAYGGYGYGGVEVTGLPRPALKEYDEKVLVEIYNGDRSPSMDASGPGSDGSCYYSLLGIRRNASASDIRSAYRCLALKWHPDRWAKEPAAASGEAKRRFQRIQEAYSVLSDKGKRAMYDAGFYDPLDDDGDQDFSDFMQEMLAMMDGVKSEKPDTLEDLQRMLAEIVDGDSGSSGTGGHANGRRVPSDSSRRSRSGPIRR